MGQAEDEEKSTSVAEIIFSASKAVAFLTILAFCGSYLYIVTFQLRGGKSFAPYFLPLDYVQLAPIWILPICSVAIFSIVVGYLVTSLLFSAHCRFDVVGRAIFWLPNWARQSNGQRKWSSEEISAALKEMTLVDMALFGVLFFSFVITFLLTLSPWIQRRVDAALFVFPAIMASTGVLTALDAILRYNPSVLGLSGLAERLENNRLLSLGISSVPAFLVCAMCAGYFYGPALLDKTKNSRIDCDIEEHRPGEINGKIIFLLSRHVIVLSKGSVVAIANEKVHSIETPPLAR